MNKEQEQGLFNQIEEVLHTHEETYELGAWEEFDTNRKKNKRKWPLYIWTAAAVVLLIAGFGLLEMTKKDEQQNNQALVKNLKEPLNIKADTGMHSKKNLPMAIEQSTGVVARMEEKTYNPVNPIVTQTEQLVTVQKNNPQSENTTTTPLSTSTVIAMDKAIVQKQDKFAPVTAGAYDSLVNRNHALASVDKSAKKLTYSLVVAPSVSNQRMNFGAGMELSYALGKGISINSGLLYTALNAKSNGKSLMATNSMSRGASLAVSGIELPLGIQYQTDKGFYATAGVSAVGLLNDKLEYSYLQESTVTKTEFNAGVATEVYKVVSERKTEESIEPLNNYMGFFNFSAGKKQAFGKVNLNIGPFVKVPFSSVSSEKIKLVQGGVKISVDF